MKNRSKILVTGGAGFIGSHLCELMLSKGNQVICVDNFNNFYDPVLKVHNISSAINNPGFMLYKADIRDKKDMELIFDHNNPGLVIHLAAMPGVRPSIENPQLYLDVNINGTLVLLETMRKFGVRDMIFASSSSVYGNNKKTPFSESDPADNQISPYAFSKRAGELLCNQYCNLHDFNISCLRFFTVYGPRQRPDLAIHKFTDKIQDNRPIDVYGNGSSSRDYTFIYDAIDGIYNSAYKLNGFNIYNIGESETVSLNRMIEILEKILGKKAIKKYLPAQAGDVERTFADITKARREIDYNPSYNFEDGIRHFVRWKNDLDNCLGIMLQNHTSDYNESVPAFDPVESTQPEPA